MDFKNNRIMNWYKRYLYASSVSQGWILPNSSIQYVPLMKHEEYIMNNHDKFGIDERRIEYLLRKKDFESGVVYTEAFRNGAIRFDISEHDAGIAGSKNSISRSIEIITNMLKVRRINRIYADILSGGRIGSEVFDTFEEFLRYFL